MSDNPTDTADTAESFDATVTPPHRPRPLTGVSRSAEALAQYGEALSEAPRTEAGRVRSEGHETGTSVRLAGRPGDRTSPFVLGEDG